MVLPINDIGVDVEKCVFWRPHHSQYILTSKTVGFFFRNSTSAIDCNKLITFLRKVVMVLDDFKVTGS